MYVPASRCEELLAKAIARADAVVLDLEDAVHPSARAAARASLARVLTQPLPVPVAVRVNEAGSADFLPDLVAVRPLVAAGLIQYVRLPKTEHSHQVSAVWSELSETAATACVVPLLESSVGVRNAHLIAAAPGVAGLGLGESDLRADLGLPRTGSEDGLLLARQTVVLAARATGLPNPTASVFPNIKDDTGLRASCRKLSELGFYGRSVIHPAQIAAVREEFAPTAEEIQWADGVLRTADAISDAGVGAAALSDGSFVDNAIVRQAHVIRQRVPS